MNPDIAMRMREQLITRLKLLRDENRLLSRKVKIIQQRKKTIADEISQIKKELNK